MEHWKRFLESPFSILLIFRLFVMISIVSFIFFDSEVNPIPYWVAIIFFIISYLFLQFFKRVKWVFFLLELLISLPLGYHSMGIVPYQLLIGLVGCALFIYYENRILYIGWPVFLIFMIIADGIFGFYQVVHLIINYSFIIFACTTGGLIHYAYKMKNRFQSLYQELNTSYQKLQEQALTVQQLSKEEERNRIAREIHDTVGHTVTALIVQLEAARKLMTKDPKKSIQILQTIEELARLIYQEIRFSIEANQYEDWETVPLTTLCEQLLANFAKLTKLAYCYRVKGEAPASLPYPYKFSLFRILQETLTNAKRHGKAKKVSVELVFLEESIRLQIEDDGMGSEELKVGFGLKNVQRRVEDLGGTCQFETRKGKGFRTVVQLPIRKGVEDG